MWEKVKLNSIAQIIAGQSPKSSFYNELGDGLPFFQGNADFGALHPKIRVFTSHITKVSRPNDLLISVRAPVGALNINNIECCIGRGLSAIRPFEKLNLKYLYYFLSNYKNKLKDSANGAVFEAITTEQLKNIEVPLPPLPVQEKIAAILDKADALRRKDQELKKKYDELAQAVFIDMFGDPVKNEKGWEVKKLGELGKVITGNTPSREVKEYYGDFIEWIKTDNIIPTKIFPEKSKEQLSKEGLKVGRMVPNGSVLVTCIAGSKNSIGNCALANRELAFNQQINAFVPNTSNYVSVFLYYLFKLNKVYIQNSTTDGMKKIITKSSFEELIFIVPPILLQQAFVKKIELINELKAKTNTDKSEELFQSLLQRAFKGELVK